MSRPPGKAKGMGVAIQRARLERGWSQVELGRQASLSRPTIARVERGEQPSVRTLSKLAEALGLKFDLFER